ncbi:MAG TPA: hypothetical protein VFZ91_02840 [Allosphingosinicella sp.]
MDMSPSAQQKLVDQSRRAHVEDLLRRYPDVDAGEAAEILRFLKKGPPLEVALIGTDDELKVKLGEFRENHASEFCLGLKEYLSVATIVVALIAVLALLWDAGLGR